jgi:uncharacterized membrane protein
MAQITRDDFYIISKYSTWEAEHIETAFRAKKIYPDAPTWTQFAKIFTIGLGSVFFILGVVFFFAFNWDELHKFVKLGIVEALVIIPVAVLLLTEVEDYFKKILLTVASVLTGTIFAVFGQVYQTGANAYDLFLIWTICITLWVILADFQPLYLFYIALLNTTFALACAQTNLELDIYTIFSVLFAINAVALFGLHYLAYRKKIETLSVWFDKTLTIIVLLTVSIPTVVGIFGDLEFEFAVTLLLLVLTFGGGIWYAVQKKRLFYIAIIGTFTILILTCLIGNVIEDNVLMLLANSLFVGAGFTGLVKLSVALKAKGYE